MKTPRSADQLIPAVVGIPTDAAASAKHRISAGDVLKVTVFQVEELSTEERVNDRGEIVLPLIGPTMIAGITTEEAERRIEGALRQDFLQDPQVDIFVSEFANMKVTVGGEVRKPGVFPMTGRTTLLQAIAEAGGLTDIANKKEIILFRSMPDRRTNAYVINLKQVARGELGDPTLMGNDKILVSKSGSAAFIKSVTSTLRGFVSVRALTF